MYQEQLKNFNTFGKGRWIYMPSKNNCPKDFEKNANALVKFCQGSTLCLSKLDKAKQTLQELDLFVFVDKNELAQIVCDNQSDYNSFRGRADGIEQNVDTEFIDVANEFLENSPWFENCSTWQYQINWIERLKTYQKLFTEKQYKKIDVKELIKDLGYNGYSIHYPGCTKANNDKIYYPQIKKQLLLQPMLKPMIAKELKCDTREVAVGKYQGNGKHIKYIVGDLTSKYLDKSCEIQKVYGSIYIKDYVGNVSMEKLLLVSTYNAIIDGSVDYNQDDSGLVEDLFADAHEAESEYDFEQKNLALC